MNTRGCSIVGAIALVLGINGVAVAADKGKFDLGKAEYQNKCAVCHGPSGKGDGGVIDVLKTAPADLTVLSKKNGGVFPFDRVYGVIDGRELVKGHGSREMPIWGQDYSLEHTRAAEYYVDVPFDMEMYVRARVLALIDYINRLQQK